MIWRTYNYFPVTGAPAISALPWNGVTHILDVFWGVKADGTLDPDMLLPMSGHTAQLIGEAHSRGVKVLLCVGGIDGPGTPSGTNLFNAATANPLQTALNIVNVCHQHGFDGVALDWEPNIPFDQTFATLTNLLCCLRVRLHSYYTPKILTCNAAAHPAVAPLWGGEAIRYLDRLHVMPVNLVGHSVGRSFFNAALYGGNVEDNASPAMSVDSTVNMYLKAGVPARKINVLLPFYGWRLYSSAGPFQTAINAGIPPDQADIPHTDIINTLLPTATYTEFNNVARVPWSALPGGSWLSYENAQSITEKVEYVYRHELGGFDSHHIGSAYFPNAADKYPLWNAAASVPLPNAGCVVDVDDACLTMQHGYNQVFTGTVRGQDAPSTLDGYVFNLDESGPRWMPAIPVQPDGSWSRNPPHDGNPFPVGPGEYWFYLMRSGDSQILAKHKFKVLATVP